jgi:DNA-binding NtrC family response regulator
MVRVLVVDDEAQMRKALHAVLKRKGFDVVLAESGEDALSKFSGSGFGAVVSDVRMTGMTGIDLLRSIKKVNPSVPVIMMTAYGTIESAIEAMREGAEDYVLKPFSSEVIESALQKALAPAHSGGRGIVTACREILDMLEVAKSIAPTPATVLITGESGTGKELLARFIHDASDRRDNPFVSVNCASIPDGLLESELFGHEKGAFTGADSRRTGKFEQAQGGTLLLDEVGDMGLLLQTKLLRALQERVIDRVGGTTPVPVDIRVIATTNADLTRAVDEKKFRADLYYRLNVFPFHMPSLRERPEDIKLLAGHFMKKFSEKYGRAIKAISPEAIGALAQNPWRGNVRELENIMERAVLLCQGDTILPGHLFYGSERPPERTVVKNMPESSTIRDMERALIFRVLDETSGNRTKAAEKLGISVRTLRNKLAEYSAEGFSSSPDTTVDAKVHEATDDEPMGK